MDSFNQAFDLIKLLAEAANAERISWRRLFKGLVLAILVLIVVTTVPPMMSMMRRQIRGQIRADHVEFLQREFTYL